MYAITHHIDSDKVARIGIQPVDIRLASAARVLLAEIQNIAVFLQLADKLGDRRYAQIDLFAQFGDCRITISDVILNDFFLQHLGPVVTLGCNQKLRSHIFRLSRKNKHFIPDIQFFPDYSVVFSAGCHLLPGSSASPV